MILWVSFDRFDKGWYLYNSNKTLSLVEKMFPSCLLCPHLQPPHMIGCDSEVARRESEWCSQWGIRCFPYHNVFLSRSCGSSRLQTFLVREVIVVNSTTFLWHLSHIRIWWQAHSLCHTIACCNGICCRGQLCTSLRGWSTSGCQVRLTSANVHWVPTMERFYSRSNNSIALGVAGCGER